MHSSQPGCPICQTPGTSDDIACRVCGLVFATQPHAVTSSLVVLPPSASDIPCSGCGQPLPSLSPACPTCASTGPHTFQILAPGHSLANSAYSIQRVLSRGGMGAVYLATDHTTFDRPVVIKTLLDYFDPTNTQEVQAARERFVQEARTLAMLRHPTIPQIFTAFQDAAQNYIVLEYIEGRDLEQGLTQHNNQGQVIVAGKPYPHRDVLHWGIMLCRVLEYLARQQPHPVVHHDIKPANLLLDSITGDVRLVDFGTAKARLLMQSGGRVGLQRSSIYGTQGYAPPEQYRGISEPRSDVYALAATLYHLVTDDDPQLHPFSFPRLSQVGLLGELLAPALHLDVTQRPTAAQLRQQLEALQKQILAQPQPILAPDGTHLTNERELVAWCEQHWYTATQWLFTSLPDLVEHLWLAPQRAELLRSMVSRHQTNPDAALNAALARLDSHGFGLAHPQLRANMSTIVFGPCSPQSTQTAQLVLTNTGRRYIRGQLVLPDWVRTPTSTIALLPGQQTVVTLTAAAPASTHQRDLYGLIELRQAGHRLLLLDTCWTRAEPSSPHPGPPPAPPTARPSRSQPAPPPTARSWLHQFGQEHHRMLAILPPVLLASWFIGWMLHFFTHTQPIPGLIQAALLSLLAGLLAGILEVGLRPTDYTDAEVVPTLLVYARLSSMVNGCLTTWLAVLYTAPLLELDVGGYLAVLLIMLGGTVASVGSGWLVGMGTGIVAGNLVLALRWLMAQVKPLVRL